MIGCWYEEVMKSEWRLDEERPFNCSDSAIYNNESEEGGAIFADLERPFAILALSRVCDIPLARQLETKTAP